MATFDTRFGELNLSSWSGSSSSSNKASGVRSNPYSFIFSSDGNQYRFIPEDVIQKGFTDAEKKRQFYLTNALNKDSLKSLYEKGEAVDLAGGLNESQTGQLTNFGYSTKGVLVPESDYTSLGFNRSKSYAPEIIDRGAGVGFITGLGQDKQGNLMYGGEQLGRSQYAYIDQEGRKAGYEKSKWGGFLGDMFYDVGKTIAGVPGLPEVLGLATGNPYVYASTKGLAAGASGEDPLEAGLKIGATIGVTQALSGAGGQPTGAEAGGADYSLTAGGADVGGTGFQSVGAEGFQAGAASPATSLLDTGLGSIDYNLLAGTAPGQLVGETGLTVGGEGLRLPTTPEVAGMGGGQGLTVPVAGGTITGAGFIPVGSTPALGDPSSFINDPNVLGQPVFPAGGSTLSLTDALRGMNLANQLMAGQQQPMGMPQQQAPFQPAGVDYSGILGLLGRQASIPNISSLLGPAQIRYPNSLLG